jgi:MoaA/NifB/PqqE/SkfB family radical SAM enzyme
VCPPGSPPEAGTQFVVADIVVDESNCNLSCEYCLTGQSNFKAGHAHQDIFRPPRPQTCRPGTPLRAQLDRLVEEVARRSIPVAKFSGGEVTLVDGFGDFLEEKASLFETVVVLTNGMGLRTSELDRIDRIGNVVVQLSLDATAYEGNSYRVRSASVHRTVMRRARAVLERPWPIELYLVLTDRSIGFLEDTLRELLPYAGRLTVLPFPVRGPAKGGFAARPDQHADLDRLVECGEEFAPLLPHPRYLERLRRFYAEGGRTSRCHLPRVAFTSFEDGLVTSCPNIWFDHVGRLGADEPDPIAKLDEAPFRRLLLSPRPRVDACRGCFTPWDLVSLYFDGEITLEELTAVPMYAGPRTTQCLADAKARYTGRVEEPC